jgi:hypothetical protein
MLEVHEHRDALRDDVVRLLAANVRDEPDAARVVLVPGIVEALLFDRARFAVGGDHPR